MAAAQPTTRRSLPRWWRCAARARLLGYPTFARYRLDDTMAKTPEAVRSLLDRVCGEADIAEAMKLYRIRAKWTAKSLALHTQAVLQGAFILAKAKGGAEIAAASIDHLHRYIELLFEPAKRRGKEIS
jgi:TetR/AcrR family transcriptional regulator, transcriptional repressor for nem operon